MAYIEREALLKVLRGSAVAKYPASFAMGLFAAADEVSKLPAADVQTVVHGRWGAKDGCIVCNQCGALLAVIAFPSEPDEFDELHSNFKEMFCYKCGARMDGDG